VVDDEEIVRESCKRVLTDAGYTVRTAANGREALRVCRDEPFDLQSAESPESGQSLRHHRDGQPPDLILHQ
jgi:CheY-like chemotaxis protein